MGLLHAIVFGADGACIDMGLSSILSAVAVFMTAVVLLQVLGARALRALSGRRTSHARVDRKVRKAWKDRSARDSARPSEERPADRRAEKRTGPDKYDNGPIISNRRM